MKILGLIGGMNWQSTVEYYTTINEILNKRLGKNHSAKLLLYSVDFEEIITLQIQKDWNLITEKMIKICKNLEKAGAEGIIICSNTMHLVAKDLEKEINIPIINVIDVIGEKINKECIKSVGLLGTKFTMEEDFYKDRLRNKHSLEVIVPIKKDIEKINEIIYKELAQGQINSSSKKEVKRIIEELIINGAEGIIMGCTELPLIIDSSEVEVTLFDTLKEHMAAAIEFSLNTTKDNIY